MGTRFPMGRSSPLPRIMAQSNQPLTSRSSKGSRKSKCPLGPEQRSQLPAESFWGIRSGGSNDDEGYRSSFNRGMHRMRATSVGPVHRARGDPGSERYRRPSRTNGPHGDRQLSSLVAEFAQSFREESSSRARSGLRRYC